MNQGLVVPGSWARRALRDEQGQVLGALSIAAVESRMDEERQFQLAAVVARGPTPLAQASPGEGGARAPACPQAQVLIPPPAGTGLHPEETAMSKRAVIAGWSHIPFGKLDDPDTESLMARVSGAAWTMPASPPRKSTASTSAS